jgi:16S rRNA (uracil1498-N3)-methyltransferase
LPAEHEETRLLLALRPGAQALPEASAQGMTVLSGPEGGLSAAEEDAALNAGFRPVTLGPRVLRAETAPLAVLSRLG